MKALLFLFLFLPKHNIMLDTQVAAIVNAINNNYNLNKIGASGGTVYYGTGTVTGGLNGSIIQIREATVMSAISGISPGPKSAVVDLLALFGISGITLNATDLLIVPQGYIITGFTIASGSILLYS